jgi:hypothetical protein
MTSEIIEDNTLNQLIKKQHYINLIHKVKDVNGAISHCKELNIDVSRYEINDNDPSEIVAYKKLVIVIIALNEGWKPNQNDNAQYKYYNYFYMNNGTFSFTGTTYATSYMGVPSALFFKSRELAQYAGRAFIEIYKDYYLIL